MKSTEKQHWVNGHQCRGGYFHTYTASLLNIGLMISTFRHADGRTTHVTLFKLVSCTPFTPKVIQL